MASEPRYLTDRERLAGNPASALRTLLYVSSQGMVFKSAITFDSGTRLAVGLHLHKIRGDLGLPEHGDGLYGDRFLQLQGLVADCKIVEASPAERFFQVTLLFDNLSEPDRVLLSAIEHAHRARPVFVPEVARRAASIPGAGGLN